MNPEPNQQDADGNRQNYQTRKPLLKPDQNKSDKSRQKREKHIHKRILAQDTGYRKNSINQGFGKGLLFRMDS